MATEERAGHHWQEPERVAEYIDRMDQQEAERAVIFGLMAKLVPAEPDAAISVLDVGSGYGPVAAAILAAIGLEALGLGPQNDPTLGMTIYWSMFYGAVLSGWWWWYAPPIVVLVWIFVALYMTSSGLDTSANPKLRRI